MRPPDQIFPQRKAAEFDEAGRPHHYLFYTSRPNFYKLLYVCIHKTSIFILVMHIFWTTGYCRRNQWIKQVWRRHDTEKPKPWPKSKTVSFISFTSGALIDNIEKN